jgi:hypothetical protein
MHLRFETPERGGESLFDWGYLLVDFRGEELVERVKEGLEGKGFERLADGRLFIMHNRAELIGPPLKPGAFGTLQLQFVPDGRHAVGARVFALDVIQLNAQGRPAGGQRFLLKTMLGMKRPCWDNQLGTFDGVGWNPKCQGGCPGSCC